MGRIPKKWAWTVCRFKGGGGGGWQERGGGGGGVLGKKGGVVFLRGVDTTMHTMDM